MATGRPPRELAPFTSDSHRLGAELRYWRQTRGLTQKQVACRVHQSETLICKIEKADRNTSLDLCHRLDTALETGGVLSRIWKATNATEEDCSSSKPRDTVDVVGDSLRWVARVSEAVDMAGRMWRSELTRRTLLASTTWVATAFLDPFHSWMTAAPDELVSGGGRRVTQTEVAALWAMCTSFTDADHRLGGGYARSTLIHYLDTVVRPLLKHGAYTGRVGRELMAAAARLCDLCAFMSFDSAEQGLAQRYFIQALRLAHASGNRTLGAHILGDMSMQAHHLGNADLALELATAGYQAGLDGGSPATAARCAALQGRAYARRGDRAAAARSRIRAEQCLDMKSSEEEPSWIQFFTADQLTTEAQYMAAELGDHSDVRRIGPLIVNRSSDMQRRRALAAATLAEAYLPGSGRGSDIDYACDLLLGVLPSLPSLTSSRAGGSIDDVRRGLQRHESQASVRNFEAMYENLCIVQPAEPSS